LDKVKGETSEMVSLLRCFSFLNSKCLHSLNAKREINLIEQVRLLGHCASPECLGPRALALCRMATTLTRRAATWSQFN
jgi:hypothetical protein